ncbi:MAG: CsbD family protein [Egibacteraceae bacterium]
MAGSMDKAKGRAKEAFGRLTGDRRLEREGRVDRSAGALKQTIDRVKSALTGRGRPPRYQ